MAGGQGLQNVIIHINMSCFLSLSIYFITLLLLLACLLLLLLVYDRNPTARQSLVRFIVLHLLPAPEPRPLAHASRSHCIVLAQPHSMRDILREAHKQQAYAYLSFPLLQSRYIMAKPERTRTASLNAQCQIYAESNAKT